MSLTFGKPDPNILRSPGGTNFNNFNSFSFKSIGKEPELLKRMRMSNREEEGFPYQHSPSPEPESHPAHYGAEGRTRPSLLQALTNETNEESFSMSFDSQPTSSLADMSSVKSPGMEYDSMQLQYPETPVAVPLKSPPPPPPPPPFVPDYSALKALHVRLEISHKELAAPPSPKKAQTPLPDFPRPSLIAANNAVHHTEKTHTSAKEALEASRARLSISEKGVVAAQAIVDTLTQALLASRAALEVAKKSFEEARQAAEEAQAALRASRAAADAAEETKRLLEEPPPPRPPTPEPVNPNAKVIDELKKDLDTLKLWVEEQEVGHLPVTASQRDTGQDQEEEEREASNMMIAPDDTDIDVEVRHAETTAFATPVEDREGGEADMDLDEPRRVSEEDAAEALVALADQKIAAQDEDQPKRAASSMDVMKGKLDALTVYTQAEVINAEELQPDEVALAREAALRKMQDAQREKVRIQKEQAHAAAAMSILKERQDAAAAAKNKSPTSAQSCTPSSDADPQPQSGNAATRAVVLPPSTSAEGKAKMKKTKPVSGGVKLGPDIIAQAEPCVPMDPSPALERAAALGLRMRVPPASQSAPSSKISPSQKVRNCSLPPISHLVSSPPAEIFSYRTGLDKGDIHIIQPSKAPRLPLNLSTDIQLLNLRSALQDEGIPWEAISRSRPKLSVVKTEAPEDGPVCSADHSLLASHPEQNASRQFVADPQFGAVQAIAPAVASPVARTGPLPLPSRKQLPKINKLVPPAMNVNNTQSVQAVVATLAQSPPTPHVSDAVTAQSRPTEVSPISIPPKGASPAGPAASTPNKQGPTSPAAQAQAGVKAVAPLPDTPDIFNYRSLTERVSERGRSPPRFDGRSPRARSKTPERYGGTASYAHKGELLRYDRGTPDSYGSRNSGPKWTPEPPVRRPLTPPRAYTPPRAQRPVSPPRRHEPEFSVTRSFSGDHYSPGPPPRRSSATNSPWARSDSPPRGPRYTNPQAPSNSHKRPREDNYNRSAHAQKRFKDERDLVRAPAHAASPPRPWAPGETENERPTLEHRLGAPDPNVHFFGRGESYRPQPETPSQAQDGTDERPPKPDGLLSRLSDPTHRPSDPACGNARGRGGARGRANNRGRGGRGRGERSLVDRMV